MSRKHIGAGAIAVLLGIAIAALALTLGPAPSRDATRSRLPPATAEIVLGSLAETRTATGTLSLGEAFPVTPASDAGPRILTWMAPEGLRVERGQPLYAIDGRPVTLFYGDAPFFRTLRFETADFASFDWLELEDAQDDVREAELKLAFERAGLADAESRRADLQNRLDDSGREDAQTREFMELKGAVAFEERRLDSLRQLYEADAASAFEVQAAERNRAAAHANLESGIRLIRQQLLSAEAEVASSREAVVVAERNLEEVSEELEAMGTANYGASDVTSLQENLAALGYSGPAGETLREWQADAGLPANGIIEPGQIVVAPGPVQIAEHIAQPGDTIEGPALSYGDANRGQPVLSYTGTVKLVHVPLGVADHAFAEIGRSVTVVLPDLTEVDGVISEVGAVVSEQAQTEVTIAIPDQGALGALEAASVDVTFVSERRDDVLTVPVTALLARPEGGFGVEVVDGTISRVVPVTTGLFANGRVEISGEDISEGMTVGVPG